MRCLVVCLTQIDPAVVNEAEFRLTDELFDVGKFVAAPNGQSLAIVYEQALNNLVPKYQDDPLRRQRERIREWLLGKVDGSVLSTGSSISQSLSDEGSPSKVYGMQEFQALVGCLNSAQPTKAGRAISFLVTGGNRRLGKASWLCDQPEDSSESYPRS